MKINAKKLYFINLNLIMVVRLIGMVVPYMSVLGYIPDINNVILLFFSAKTLQRHKNRNTVRLIMAIGMLFLFDIFMFLLKGENILLFIWGMRNQYRFILFLLNTAVLLETTDIEKIFHVLYRWLMFNFLVILIEFGAGYRRDYLGGTFGLDQNCNGVTNIFLIIISSYMIAAWLSGQEKCRKTITALGVSFLWAALAEIKIFFIEIIIITIILTLIIKGRTLKKLQIIGLITMGVIAGITVLAIIFPDQISSLSIKGLIIYARHVNLGTGGFGRTTAIPMTNKLFFDGDMLLKLFGIGTGNGEMMNIGRLNLQSEFYRKNSHYAYTIYFYAFIYVERGIVGLLWYFGIICKNILRTWKIKKSSTGIIHTMSAALFSVLTCFILVMVYDGSFRVSTGGYLAFMAIAIPYVLIKDKAGK